MNTAGVRKVDRIVYAVLAATAALIAGLIVGHRSASADPACTTGAVSSIGPIVVVDGHVSGDTTPHSECLP